MPLWFVKSPPCDKKKPQKNTQHEKLLNASAYIFSASLTWHMNSGMILWNTHPLNPKPCSPVHRALKFSVKLDSFVLKEIKRQVKLLLDILRERKKNYLQSLALCQHSATGLKKIIIKCVKLCLGSVCEVLARQIPQWLFFPQVHCPLRCPETRPGSWRDRRRTAGPRRHPVSCISDAFLFVALLLS